MARRLPVVLLLAALGGAFLGFATEIPRFSILSHAFRPAAVSLILWSLACFVALLTLWVLFAGISSRLYGFPGEKILNLSLLTWLPLLFLSLMPFALRHYLTAGDLLNRAKLFGLAVAAAVIYLNAILVLRLRRWKGKTESRTAGRFAALPIKKKLALLFAVSLVLFERPTSLVIVSRAIFVGGESDNALPDDQPAACSMTAILTWPKSRAAGLRKLRWTRNPPGRPRCPGHQARVRAGFPFAGKSRSCFPFVRRISSAENLMLFSSSVSA